MHCRHLYFKQFIILNHKLFRQCIKPTSPTTKLQKRTNTIQPHHYSTLESSLLPQSSTSRSNILYMEWNVYSQTLRIAQSLETIECQCIFVSTFFMSSVSGFSVIINVYLRFVYLCLFDVIRLYMYVSVFSQVLVTEITFCLTGQLY